VKETTELIKEDESLLESLSEQALPFEDDEEGRVALSSVKLRNAPYPIAARGIRRAAAKLGCYPAAVHVKAAWELVQGDNPSASTQFPDGVKVSREYDLLIFTHFKEKESLVETVLEWNRWTEVPSVGIAVWFGEKTKIKEPCDEIFPLKKSDICGELKVRARRTGDRICLARRQGSKTLKKLFIEKKIPAERRDRLPIIADEKKIIAISKLGRAADISSEGEADCVIAIKPK